ncbi:hypothetical protein ACLHDG_08260 [Sulfurovum sp. CS9]|uniref:hypothetical protein n=1 Tax=Sulfurovum sp. CS9 TaxID=3391146 RepID=UPI0039E849F8
MSKIKDEMERTQEIEYEQYVSFMEWVCDQKAAVSESDSTNEVEEDSLKSSTTRTSIVPANTLNSANNINYNPCKGA